MFNIEFIPTAIIFFTGFTVGVIVVLFINKLRTGNVSPSAIIKEKEDYQAKVEAHFDETAKKFKDMTAQYQELYQHLSVGATNLCRPEKITAGLIEQANPLKPLSPIDVKAQNNKMKPSMAKPVKDDSKDKS